MRRLGIALLGAVIACSSPISPQQGHQLVRPCLQTGFGHSVDARKLAIVAELGWSVVRLDNQRVDRAESARLADEARQVGLTPLVVVRDALGLVGHPPGGLFELRNEPDLEGPTPEVYRVLMMDAARVAAEQGHTLYVGAVSNLNDRGFDYLRRIRPFPPNVRISVHRYGDGSFAAPHSGFDDREREVYWLRETIGALPFAVTEFGYPDGDLSEEEVATRVRSELEFWYEKADFACLYQLDDGGNPRDAINRFGIFRLDGTVKPSGYVLR